MHNCALFCTIVQYPFSRIPPTTLVQGQRMPIEIEQAELLAQVAHLYFEKGDDQTAIARRLHVSRSSISRLLAQARREGIVEIQIHYPLPREHNLESALCAHFSLKEAHVLRSPVRTRLMPRPRSRAAPQDICRTTLRREM